MCVWVCESVRACFYVCVSVCEEKNSLSPCLSVPLALSPCMPVALPFRASGPFTSCLICIMNDSEGS